MPRQGKIRLTLVNAKLSTSRLVVVDRGTGRLSKRQARETWSCLCKIANFPYAGLLGEWPLFQHPKEAAEAPVPIWYRIEKKGKVTSSKHGLSDLYVVPYTTEEKLALEAEEGPAPAAVPEARKAVA